MCSKQEPRGPTASLEERDVWACTEAETTGSGPCPTCATADSVVPSSMRRATKMAAQTAGLTDERTILASRFPIYSIPSLGTVTAYPRQPRTLGGLTAVAARPQFG